MPLSETVRTDFIFKKIKGRRETDVAKAWYEEFPGSLTFLTATEVWADEIPVPAPGATNSVVQYYADLKLTEDLSTQDHKAWLACSTPGDTSTQLKGFVPPRFDQSYTVRLFQDDGNGNAGDEVPTAHPSNWIFDYENGVLKFENDPTTYGLTTPFHIRAYKYIGTTIKDTNSSTSSKLRAFLREASQTTVTSGSSSVDVSSQMNGKTPGGSETSQGVVTVAPYNRVPVLSYPSRDQILTADGEKVYGRLTESNGTWTLTLYYLDNTGTEQTYTAPADTDIIWGYYEVLPFEQWPTFPDDMVLPSDQVVGEIPDATEDIKGKVELAQDNEVATGPVVVRSDDPRAKKATDFALEDLSGDGTNITAKVGPGVWNLNGDKTTETTLTATQAASTYYLIYLDMENGNVAITSDTTPPKTPENSQALYRFNTDASNAIAVVEDVRPIYAMGVGGGTGLLGVPTDGTYQDGLLDFQPTTKINDSIDDINEVLKYLAPADAKPLAGDIPFDNTFITGKIAGGTTLHYLTAGQSFDKVFKETALTGHTPDAAEEFNKADKGLIKIYVNDSETDNFDLGSHFDEANRAGCQTYTPANSTNNYITVTKVCWYNNFPMWQQGNVDINVPATAGQDIKVKLARDVDGDGNDDQATNEFIGFCDAETARPGIGTTPSVSEGTTTQFKYLSGIKFYTLNSTFKISTASDAHLFEYTYVDNPIVLSLPGMNDVAVATTDTTVTGVANPPNYNDTMTITNKVVTLDKPNVASDDAKAVATPYDPWGAGTAGTENITDKRLINTYGNVATDLTELFQDENYRLPDTFNFDDKTAAVTGNWDSTAVLTNGDAQVFNGKLIVGSVNYTTGYLPAQNTNANYSTFSGDQVYYRAIQQANTPHSNGTLFLEGITSADIGSKVDVYIKLPTQTGWLDLSKDYLAASFTGADGDGAKTSMTDANGGVQIGWTAGTFSTADSGYRYYVKVVIHDATVQITQLAEQGW